MRSVMSPGSHVLLTTSLLFLMGSAAQRVFFDCGAKVDVVDVQGLILSPGFPYNYSSGTHCVWLFVVPVKYQLVLEVFDFDVFENQDWSEEEVEEGMTSDPAQATETEEGAGLRNNVTKTQQSSQDGEVKAGVRLSTGGGKGSNSASAGFLLPPGTSPSGAPVVDSASMNPGTQSTDVEERTGPSSSTTDPPAVSLDICPHDVLYISDLVTFSSRFCGSNRPPGSQLVFGSSQERVEVIMELITTTHWGRGFALLFHYHNLTDVGPDIRVSAPAGSRAESMLAAVSGAAFFAMILTSALCIIFRPKLCRKKSNSCLSSNSEAPEGVQNPGSEVSELQLMTENQTSRTQDQDGQVDTALSVDVFQNAPVDLSGSGLTELDLGSDEVFIVSSAFSPTKTTFTPHTAPPTLTHESRAADSRRVFSDVHLEAKADDSALSDSTISNASYPLTQAAQQQRRLNSTSNLLRSRFPGPSCGLLSGTATHSLVPALPKSQGPSSESTSGPSPSTKVQMESRKIDFPGEGDHVSVPVFVISEEDDRLPLVSAEHLDQNSAPAVLNGLAREKHEEEQGPVHQRARLEWRPRGSQVRGGVCPLSAHMF
ncbi:uncharacterized protein LOC103398114 isoform X2 [Cynoglossus semilaevis]|uniref:uncharacterized protein LOC103398114 isoform X2 n=1 Tax=Cynoglossus semilaevis TaxID=244447 RepID=UPI000D62F271|nr:uncharacterized protein LOC103398114 isoform X2 [Cynoglossus semilaevis]